LTISELSSALTQLGDPLTNLEVKQMLRQARYVAGWRIRLILTGGYGYTSNALKLKI
jgi:hypothetical protein